MLADDEISAMVAPVALAAATNDTGMPAGRRHNITALMQAAGPPFSAALYSGTNHGFGVRVNISDPQQKFGKESAFFQAVRWFETWAV
jgi:dienelactone hydrolase